MTVLDKVRRWIDGESAELVLEDAARAAQVKPRSEAEEFIVKIARAVESVMQKELLPLPQGTAIIPSEYKIFLSESDDRDWQGVKRRGLEQGLYHILAERAKEIAGKKKLETKSFVLELRVDGTLDKGTVRVQHSWEDAESGKTGVLARPKPAAGISKDLPAPAPQNYQPPAAAKTTPNFTENRPSQHMRGNAATNTGSIGQAVPISADLAEEMTSVRQRPATELYRLEIWKDNVRQNVVPIYQKDVSVGRGSRSKPVDIALAGDPEISRRHLSLHTDGLGNFWAVNEGRNAASINNYELPEGQKIPLPVGTSLTICSYILRIQARS